FPHLELREEPVFGRRVLLGAHEDGGLDAVFVHGVDAAGDVFRGVVDRVGDDRAGVIQILRFPDVSDRARVRRAVVHALKEKKKKDREDTHAQLPEVMRSSSGTRYLFAAVRRWSTTSGATLPPSLPSTRSIASGPLNPAAKRVRNMSS